MEAIGTMSEGEWNSSFNGMSTEEADFMAQLLGNCSLPNEVPSGSNFVVSSAFWPAHESNLNIAGVDESAMYSSDETNTNMYSFSQGSSYGGGSSILFPSSSHESYYPSFSHQVFVTNNNLMTMDYCVMDGKNNSSESKKSMKLKKCAKFDDNDEDNNNNNNNTNVVLHRQSSSGCCSEDDSNASHELNGLASSSSSKRSGALNSNGKTRASRGSATDPQSLYARKRRERINERLRILQSLVPNGTKVDISTMLEEAVQYVKFLQLQIKLLSSDDLWMYAPIAYNGMDIGLDLKISTPKSQP
ncbi:hypothetical protein Pfo_004845 [Paulownia fortunei]|nr:hypothetical protein Pfo_004845 [Paulownia fortunei]